MCLLIVQSATAPTLTQEWLEDFYATNSDGVGIMRSVDGELLIEKILPANAQEFVEFYNNHIDGYDCAFHLRMKTHGNIDMENCHPYEVFNKSEHGLDVWLMHNGVLSTGNAGDLTKSDTWHYIRDYLRPMLANNIDFAFTDAFAEIVGDHIGGSNKFVLMDSTGRIQTVNQSSGVYWGGRWLSNTYAWSSPTKVSKDFIDDYDTALDEIESTPYKPVYPKSNYKSWSSTYMTGYDSYDDEDYWRGYSKASTATATRPQYDRPVYVPPVGGFEDEDGDFIDGEYTVMGEDGVPRTEVYGVSEKEMDDVMEDLLMEIEAQFEIKHISRTAAYEFVEEFGIDNFMEISYMALDEMIDSSWFERVVTDFVTARQSFPWLESTKPVRTAIN
jgi:hypothetical protein